MKKTENIQVFQSHMTVTTTISLEQQINFHIILTKHSSC
jgi:hypothetical protein